VGAIVQANPSAVSPMVMPAEVAPGGLGARRLWLYALPNLSISMLVMPVAVIVPSLYIKERGVSLAAMGIILMVARIFDAVADQVLGYVSDITRNRIPGGRKFWVAVGAGVAIPAVYFLSVPPANAGAVYFTVWSLAAYFAWAALLIPYTAWGAELSRGYNERTRIAMVRSVTGQVGALLFLVVPLALPYFHLAVSTDMNLNAVRFVALAIIVLLPATIIPAIFAVPQGVPQIFSPVPRLLETLRALWANLPMRIYAGAFLISELGYGILVSVIFFYIDAYLGLGSKFSVVMILANIGMLVTLPLWEWVSRRFGKKQAWAFSWIGQAAGFLAFALVPRGDSGFIAFTVIFCVGTMFSGAAAVVAPSILADIVDYDTLKTGAYRAGNYFALYGLANKIVVALGGSIALILLGWFHYDVAHPANNGPTANSAMLVICAGLPAILRLGALFLLWRYPLDPRRQSIIRRRLEQREARAQRIPR
jgi:glycoside/pentoside/hexuronide:cation symporter, GPH family